MDRLSILGAKDYQVETVDVPEWGGAVHIRTFSGKVRDNLDAFILKNCDKQGNLINPRGLKLLTIVSSVCDKDGKLLFTESDIDALGDKSAEIINRLFDAIQRLNKLGDEAIEDAKKNS